MPAQSQEILQIDYQNPEFNRTDDWAKAIAGQEFPFADYEWTQVLAPSEEYDGQLVGATGWMINPHHSHGDFTFTHPFLRPPEIPGSPTGLRLGIPFRARSSSLRKNLETEPLSSQ
jgi:hypothetical protein